MSTYKFNNFPYGTFEISTALLLEHDNTVSEDLYADIVNLITDYSAFLEEHIKYCKEFYMVCNNNIIINCMANSEHMDILSSTTESIADLNL